LIRVQAPGGALLPSLLLTADAVVLVPSVGCLQLATYHAEVYLATEDEEYMIKLMFKNEVLLPAKM